MKNTLSPASIVVLFRGHALIYFTAMKYFPEKQIFHHFAKLENKFVPNITFLYPLKASENLTVFWCFQGSKLVMVFQ